MLYLDKLISLLFFSHFYRDDHDFDHHFFYSALTNLYKLRFLYQFIDGSYNPD